MREMAGLATSPWGDHQHGGYAFVGLRSMAAGPGRVGRRTRPCGCRAVEASRLLSSDTVRRPTRYSSTEPWWWAGGEQQLARPSRYALVIHPRQPPGRRRPHPTRFSALQRRRRRHRQRDAAGHRVARHANGEDASRRYARDAAVTLSDSGSGSGSRWSPGPALVIVVGIGAADYGGATAPVTALDPTAATTPDLRPAGIGHRSRVLRPTDRARGAGIAPVVG